MAGNKLHEPHVFSRTHFEKFDEDTLKRPYLTFQLGPGELQRLVIKIWSNDQGRCDNHLKTQDPYANSHTWFSLGLIEGSTPTQQSPSELHEFQRNVRASRAMRCHTNQWNLGISVEDDCDELYAWIESLAQAEGLIVGVFPLAKYPGWVNSVLKMEVWVYSKAGHEMPSPEPQSGCGDTIDTTVVSLRSSEVRIVDLEEVLHITNSAVQLRSDDRTNQTKNLGQLWKWFYHRHKRMNTLSDLEEAIHIARQAIEATPADHPDQAGWLDNLGITLGDKYSRIGAMADLEEAIHITK